LTAYLGWSVKAINRDYNITYGTVSIIFVCNALGFIGAAFFISTLSNRIGRAKTLIIGQALLMLGYSCIVATPPFPLVAAS
jgi:MFS family permease